jgi:hypothetical protein
VKNYIFENTGSEVIIRNVSINAHVNLYNIRGQLLQTVKAASSEVKLSAAGIQGVCIITIDKTPFKIIL